LLQAQNYFEEEESSNEYDVEGFSFGNAKIFPATSINCSLNDF